MRLISREKLTYANAMSTIAVFIALGGTSYAVAVNSVGTPQLKTGAVTSAKVKDGSLQRRDLASSAIGSTARGPRGLIGPTGAPGANGSPGANATIEAWKPIELLNGWVLHSGQDHPPPGYRKDSHGIVYLRGVVNAPGGDKPTSGDVITTLPPGYRPQYRLLAAAMGGPAPPAGGPPTAVTRLNILANGQILWIDGPTTDGDFTSLNDISFSTDP